MVGKLFESAGLTLTLCRSCRTLLLHKVGWQLFAGISWLSRTRFTASSARMITSWIARIVSRCGLSIVGVSLLAIAVCQAQSCCLTHRYREQAHSYRFCEPL